jgi:hypothetical protein
VLRTPESGVVVGSGGSEKRDVNGESSDCV